MLKAHSPAERTEKMSKNVLIISTSLRGNKSNSHALALEFERGAKESGNVTGLISLQSKTINFCKGCLACQKTLKCVIKDDAGEIIEKMKNADVIVFATPIYFYGISGQLKTLLDRTNPIYPADYKFGDIYLLTAAADDAPTTPDGAKTALDGWISCFEKAEFAGSVFAGAVNNPGDISGNSALEEAYLLGKKI